MKKKKTEEANTTIIQGYKCMSINLPTQDEWKIIIQRLNNMFAEKYGKVK